MIECTEAKNAATFKRLLPTANARVALGVANEFGFTALATASITDSVIMVLALLRAGANIDYSGGKSCTPLFVGAHFRHLAMVQALLRAGAAIHKASANGWTPMLVAVENGHLAVMEALVKAGAVVDQASTDETTPLCMASHNRHLAR